VNAVDSVRYPVGPMQRIREPLDEAGRGPHLAVIERAPEILRARVMGLSDAELARTYRQGGWTVRQIVHHLADAHMNAYVRMKLAVTEDMPVVKSWEETRWAELPEARTGDVAISVALLEGLHRRWVAFLRALDPASFRRAFRHYEWGDVTIDECVTMYSWHCRHHIAHIELALALGNLRRS
jgi:hypothetical protein